MKSCDGGIGKSSFAAAEGAGFCTIAAGGRGVTALPFARAGIDAAEDEEITDAIGGRAGAAAGVALFPVVPTVVHAAPATTGAGAGAT